MSFQQLSKTKCTNVLVCSDFRLKLLFQEQCSNRTNNAIAIADDLEIQRQELKMMMESIQREKQEMFLQQQLMEAEKKKLQEEEEIKINYEKEDLRAALEVMKIQNQLLQTN